MVLSLDVLGSDMALQEVVRSLGCVLDRDTGPFPLLLLLSNDTLYHVSSPWHPPKQQELKSLKWLLKQSFSFCRLVIRGICHPVEGTVAEQ